MPALTAEKREILRKEKAALERMTQESLMKRMGLVSIVEGSKNDKRIQGLLSHRDRRLKAINKELK